MQLYTNSVQDRFGNAQAGAQITVRTVAGAIAVIYSDNGATLTANPLTADTSGEFAFYAANGRYTYTVTASRMQSETVRPFEIYDAVEAQAAVVAAAQTSGSAVALASSLAASGGASTVGTIAAGAGAAQRNVQNKLREIQVSITDYVGGDSNSADAYPAFVAAKTIVGSGSIRFPGPPGTVYTLASYPELPNILSGPMLDVDPGVIIRIPQISGLDATYGNGSIRVVRTTRFHQSIKDVTFYATPQTVQHVQERNIWPSLANADRSTVTAVDCTTEVIAKKFNWDGAGDIFSGDIYSATTPSSYSCNTAIDGNAHMGMISMLPGETISASFSDFHNWLTTLFVVIRCDGGYYGIYGSNASGVITTFYKIIGVARLAPVTLTLETSQHDSYTPLSSVVSVKINDLRHLSICLNGVSVIDMTTASDILEAGFGNYTTAGATLTVRDLVKTQNAPSLNGHTGINIAVFGDSLSAGDGFQHVYGSWPEQLRRIFDGVAGVRIKTLANYAVSGSTSSSQLPLCTPGNITSSDVVMFLLGTNNIQGQGLLATYLSDMSTMIDTCLGQGKRVIVGVPPMFYSQAAASGRGNNTTNYQYGAVYRSGLIRLCATKNVKCVDTLGGLGSVISNYLDTSISQDSTVYDNIHPTMFGRLLLANLFGNALLGELSSNTIIGERGALLPVGGLAPGSLFSSEAGRYTVDHKIGSVNIMGVIDLPAAVVDGALVYTLPEKLWPHYSMRFACFNGLLALSYFTLSATGELRVYKSPATASYVSLQMQYNKR